MLDQMIESKDTLKESKKLVYLFSFFTVLAITTVLGVGIWHLSTLLNYYSQSGMSGDLELTTLVAPVPVTADEPPPVEEKIEKVTKVEQNVDTRKVIMLDTSVSTIIPKETSVVKNTEKPVRQGVKTELGSSDSDAKNPVPTDYRGETSTKTEGVGNTVGTTLSDGDDNEGEIIKKPTPTPKPVAKTISGGVVNGKARNLVTPTYPASARQVRAGGAVNVQVTIDEQGNVISASATSGNPLLRPAAVQAARSSKFNPTLLSGQPVKVTGIIIYNFVP